MQRIIDHLTQERCVTEQQKKHTKLPITDKYQATKAHLGLKYIQKFQ